MPGAFFLETSESPASLSLATMSREPPTGSKDGVTIALHRMQDHLPETMAQKTHNEHASKMQANAAYFSMEAAAQARERQEEARRPHEHKCQEAAEAETIFSLAIKDTLEKNAALEKHVKMVTMRSESLGTTEADFSKALLDRQEETQKHLNELSVQLCQTRSTQ